ncbi:S-glutathionyl-(chloro)hydroquinone reductase [Ascosphaera pollenicola]|nr:S-glutathionyl-(chloro)hydroquinone reductase [Ascosphaera pollenicola]
MPTAASAYLLRIPAHFGKQLLNNPAAFLLTTSSISKRILTPSSPQVFTSGTSVNPDRQGQVSSASTAASMAHQHPAHSLKESNGHKITDWVKPGDDSGEFKRQESKFRNWISKEEGARYPPEKGRYHLYVSYACPWAHRTLITRKLKGLEDIISFSAVHWHMGEGGWTFPTHDDNLPGENAIPDPVHPDFHHLSQIYYETDPDYKDRFTVPVLYDKKTKTVVSNEVRMPLNMYSVQRRNKC